MAEATTAKGPKAPKGGTHMGSAELKAMVAEAVEAMAEGNKAADEVSKATEKAAKAAAKAEELRQTKSADLDRLLAQRAKLDEAIAVLRTEIGFGLQPKADEPKAEQPKADDKPSPRRGGRGRGRSAPSGPAFDWDALRKLQPDTVGIPEGASEYGKLNYVAGFHGVKRNKKFATSGEICESAKLLLQGAVNGTKYRNGETATATAALKAAGLDHLPFPDATI